MITHIWFTIAARSNDHLKELVLRGYWDGNAKPSVEVPVGDFFGLNLGIYQIYESQYLACSPGRSLNCYFAMPYKRSARFTVTNEGSQEINSFYSNIDYMAVPKLPDDSLYFHAQYRQSAPCVPVVSTGPKINLDGKQNYVYCETRGRGHLMGVTLGVLQNANGWWGEGDDMIFVDDESKPVITGTGSEDYFLGSWNFGGQFGAAQFAHRQYGAPLIVNPERTGGQVLLLPVARRQSGDLRAVHEAHDGARSRQRSRGQLLLGGLLVSDHAVHGVPGAAAGGAADSDGEGGVAGGLGFLGFVGFDKKS